MFVAPTSGPVGCANRMLRKCLYMSCVADFSLKMALNPASKPIPSSKRFHDASSLGDSMVFRIYTSVMRMSQNLTKFSKKNTKTPLVAL